MCGLHLTDIPCDAAASDTKESSDVAWNDVFLMLPATAFDANVGDSRQNRIMRYPLQPLAVPETDSLLLILSFMLLLLSVRKNKSPLTEAMNQAQTKASDTSESVVDLRPCLHLSNL